MSSIIVLASAFGRSLMPSEFLFPKTKILKDSHAQISTFFPLSSFSKIRFNLGLYEFSLLYLNFPLCFQAVLFLFIAVLKFLTLLEWVTFFFFLPQPLISELTDVGLLWFTEKMGMVSTLLEVFLTSEYYNAKYFREWNTVFKTYWLQNAGSKVMSSKCCNEL